MKKRNASRCMPFTIALPAALMLAAATGCAVPDAGRREVPAPSPDPRELTAETAPDTVAGASSEDEGEPYDLEEEMLEEDRLDEDEPLEESIKPLAPDTFRVSEEAVAAELHNSYGLGYRVQIFASSDREAASEQRKIFMAGTGLAAYIEYEDGLYKVRVGDFKTRAEASEARAKISEDYPDCWIVSTTIRK